MFGLKKGERQPGHKRERYRRRRDRPENGRRTLVYTWTGPVPPLEPPVPDWTVDREVPRVRHHGFKFGTDGGGTVQRDDGGKVEYGSPRTTHKYHTTRVP